MTVLRVGRAALMVLLLSFGLTGQERAPRHDGPWFGLTLPPRVGEVPAVRVGTRPPRPVVLPPGEPAAPMLQGAAIKADVATIVGFATDAREREEQGSRQMWGRVAGFPSADRTVEWAAEQFRRAGMADVRVQPIAQEPRAAFWMPLAWEVRLLGDPAFGQGSNDVILDSALPLSPSTLPGGTLTAPLVYAGSVSALKTSSSAVRPRFSTWCGCRATSDRATSPIAATRASTSAAGTGTSSSSCWIVRLRPASRIASGPA